jgi:hypothetical protein
MSEKEVNINEDLKIILDRLFFTKRDYKFPLKNLSEELLENYILPNYVEKESDKYLIRDYWERISCRKNLSIEFIEKYKEKLLWRCVIYNNSLTEEFISNNLDFILANAASSYGPDVWFYICSKTDLSLEFVKAHLNNIKYEYFEKNRKLGRSNKFKIREFFKSYRDLL